MSSHFEQCFIVSVSEQEEDRDAVFVTVGAGSATDDTAVASG